MGGNSILNKAKHSENTDEWYTDRKTIEKEVINYKQQLIGKYDKYNFLKLTKNTGYKSQVFRIR